MAKNQVTIKGWFGSFDGGWDDTDTLGQGVLTVGAIVTLNLYPEGGTTGDIYWTGCAIITSISYNTAFDGIVEGFIQLHWQRNADRIMSVINRATAHFCITGKADYQRS
jgi:hypothetical protein